MKHHKTAKEVLEKVVEDGCCTGICPSRVGLEDMNCDKTQCIDCWISAIKDLK